MHHALTSLMLYLIYSVLLMCVVYSNTDTMAYGITRTVKDQFGADLNEVILTTYKVFLKFISLIEQLHSAVLILSKTIL